MGHKPIQPWHYGFCDLSHAQSAVKESKKAATFSVDGRRQSLGRGMHGLDGQCGQTDASEKACDNFDGTPCHEWSQRDFLSFQLAVSKAIHSLHS